MCLIAQLSVRHTGKYPIECVLPIAQLSVHHTAPTFLRVRSLSNQSTFISCHMIPSSLGPSNFYRTSCHIVDSAGSGA